ncbi:MAG: MarR family transcriptional regulator [Ruminococcus sp.]|nr:MarR family transcriptional regulator [Ruminococcus sp.]
MGSEMHRDESICHELNALNHIIRRKMIVSATEAGVDKVTVMHGWIMRCIDNNRDRDIYQRDLESEFGISRSSVTNILNLMEKKGYIERVSLKSDARLKKLILTENGKRMNSILKNTMYENEKRVNDILSNEEQKVFFALIKKLRDGLENNNALTKGNSVKNHTISN